MKASELMIGDWVKFKNDSETIQIDAYGLCNWIFDNIEPIPLTEEILKTNGFEYREFTSYGSMHYDHSVTVYLNKDRDIFMLIGGEQRWIEFVHELQHALRLCGLNELADDFKIE